MKARHLIDHAIGFILFCTTLIFQLHLVDKLIRLHNRKHQFGRIVGIERGGFIKALLSKNSCSPGNDQLSIWEQINKPVA
jgi:hypothetical protein